MLWGKNEIVDNDVYFSIKKQQTNRPLIIISNRKVSHSGQSNLIMAVTKEHDYYSFNIYLLSAYLWQQTVLGISVFISYISWFRNKTVIWK